MIQVKNLRKKFKNLVVLDGIDLDVNRGEVVAIIGPSGSGKSTLLRCLNFLETPDEGIISIGKATLNVANYTQRDVHALRQQTAMVFQNYNLFKNKTALQNITESLILTKNMTNFQNLKRYQLRLVNINNLADVEQSNLHDVFLFFFSFWVVVSIA